MNEDEDEDEDRTPRRQWEARELYDAACSAFERRGETTAHWRDLDPLVREAFEAIARKVNEG